MLLLVQPVGVDSAAEIARVHALARAAYYRAASPDGDVPGGGLDYEPMWRGRLGSPNYAVLAATLNERIIGFVAMHSGGTDAVELDALYVEPDSWGAGIASRLHERFDRWWAESGRMGATLEVWSQNTRAIRFYLDRGWLFTARNRPAVGGTTYRTMERHASARAD